MAIDVKTIACPQCGSTDVNMTSEAHGVCGSCGAQFTVQPRIETQNVYNEIHVDGTGDSSDGQDSCVKAEIKPSYTKDQFIRKAWIALASEDAPIEIFEENFSEVKENEHQVLMDAISVDVTYQVSVGYDRQEPYIDYETYYEDEPYIAYEKEYNSTTKQYEERQVTKYKRVQKQRQVTKYKTVTDWSALNGNHSTSSMAVVENLKGQYLDEYLFINSFRGMKSGSLVPIDGEAADKMQVSESAHGKAMSEHRSAIDRSVRYSLPGDHNRDLDWKVSNITDSSTSLFKTPEYEATICLNGKTYVKHGFPFGPMEIGGDKIENEISLEAVTGKMKSELDSKIHDRKDSIDKNISKATNGISLLTIGLLVASILVSGLIKSTPLVVGVFAIAVAAFVFNTIKVKSETAAENKRADLEIANETSKVNSEIADYSKNYKIKQREALNNKLKSLGFEPVAASEM